MKFTYLVRPSRKPLRLWKPEPIIPITIFNETKTSSLKDTLVLLDSWAVLSVFDIEIAQDLKIDLSKAQEEEFTAIGGTVVTVKLKNIPIQINGDTESFEIPVGFMKDAGGENILGQEGFFDKFSITFERSKREIEIKRV